MDLLPETIFIKEGEKDIFDALRKQGIKTEHFSHKFEHLFNKVYNNEVGYYTFRQDGKLYKFIVLPKTINLKDADKEQAFVNYLLHYYRINNIYNYDKTKKIPNSILSLAFESNNATEKAHEPLEIFEYHKTEAILAAIESFFQKHKNYVRVEKAYISQSVKHKLNLSKNIKEINKSKIHQTKKVDLFYSHITTVSYYALKLYMQRRLSQNTIYNASKLKQRATRIGADIARKYMIDKGYSLSLPKLYGHKVSKVFQRKNEYRMLLAHLRSLFGYEQFHHDVHRQASIRNDLFTSSFFINPSQFYEWYVYDILKQYANTNHLYIRFDKKEGTETKYKINDVDASSNPDFILSVTDQKVHIVLDTKWKRLDVPGDIKQADYLKLQLDSTLLEKDGYGTVSYLIYPKIGTDEKKFTVKDDKRELYCFQILEIDMDFANKDNNNLSFVYDFDIKAKELEEEQNKEYSRHTATTLTQTIEQQRAETIQQLINTNDEEEKESIGGLFDETLWQKGHELAKSLDVEIVLDEVQEILDEFGDILEEESITFLKSSSTIYAYYKDEDGVVFDYAMPGSGLWKLIEMELNTSLVCYLRLQKGVIGKDSCWIPILDKDDNRSINWVKLNEWNDSEELKGLMFGQLKFLCRNNHVKSLFDEAISLDFEHLWDILDKVVSIRNAHAHIKSMTKEVFVELWETLFAKDSNGINEIQSILNFKRTMQGFINER